MTQRNDPKFPPEFKWTDDMREIGIHGGNTETLIHKMIENVVRWIRGNPKDADTIDMLTHQARWHALSEAAVIGFNQQDRAFINGMNCASSACKHAIAIHHFGWESYVSSMRKP